MNILDDMISKGHQPDDVTYSILNSFLEPDMLLSLKNRLGGVRKESEIN